MNYSEEYKTTIVCAEIANLFLFELELRKECTKTQVEMLEPAPCGSSVGSGSVSEFSPYF